MTDLVKRLREGNREHQEWAALLEWCFMDGDPTLLQEAADEIERLTNALEFYAEADTYCAIGFFPDPPCGEFMGDFDKLYGDFTEHDYDRPMPGMRARHALTNTPLPDIEGAAI